MNHDGPPMPTGKRDPDEQKEIREFVEQEITTISGKKLTSEQTEMIKGAFEEAFKE